MPALVLVSAHTATHISVTIATSMSPLSAYASRLPRKVSQTIIMSLLVIARPFTTFFEKSPAIRASTTPESFTSTVASSPSTRMDFLLPSSCREAVLAKLLQTFASPSPQSSLHLPSESQCRPVEAWVPYTSVAARGMTPSLKNPPLRAYLQLCNLLAKRRGPHRRLWTLTKFWPDPPGKKRVPPLGSPLQHTNRWSEELLERRSKLYGNDFSSILLRYGFLRDAADSHSLEASSNEEVVR